MNYDNSYRYNAFSKATIRDHRYNVSDKGHARYLRYYYAHRDEVLQAQKEYREGRNLMARERRRTRRIIEEKL